ncbi:Mob1/phocein [Roridomyces roridus]|uniref:Mob1/phocein n=1 Tax=Roridomyces roridus TaxID=1738132 RepID=A0AAD7BMM7_9AGAR|nr:Mob1/phocein [Roridomyces roridus]
MAQVQRPLRGSRISAFYPVKNLPSLSSLDSAFQLQEYISLLIRLDVHDVDAIVSVPGRGKQKEKEKEKEVDAGDDGKKTEVTVDEACWKYEQLRRLAQDLSHPLITMLQQVCTRTTCPEMKAGEWLYLCVAHGNDGAMEQCCAIDYILHTLDSATALLNSPRAFPSRLQIPPTSHRHFSSLARRLGRIFAHAFFHHREEFEQAEAESSLYARFLALTEKFDLVPADFLVIPSRAVGNAENSRTDRRMSVVPLADVPPPTLLGAALHVDVPPTVPASTSEGATGREKSASPDGRTAPRYGRSRTDTMMLDTDKDRFPPSPASPSSAVEDGPHGLAAAVAEMNLAANQERQQQAHPAVADSPSVSPTKPATPPVEEPVEESAPPAPAALEPEQETDKEDPEAPSPLTDELEHKEQLAPSEDEGLQVVSPSSSTAPQSETPILTEVEQASPTSPAGIVPVVPPPVIHVEPATPPADVTESMEAKMMMEEAVDMEIEKMEVEVEAEKEQEKVEESKEVETVGPTMVPVPVPIPSETAVEAEAEAKVEDPVVADAPAAPAPVDVNQEEVEVEATSTTQEEDLTEKLMSSEGSSEGAEVQPMP